MCRCVFSSRICNIRTRGKVVLSPAFFRLSDPKLVYPMIDLFALLPARKISDEMTKIHWLSGDTSPLQGASIDR